MKAATQPNRMIKNALRSNALFSGICGLVFILAASSLSRVLGTVDPLILRIAGGSLLIFAMGLVINSASNPISRGQAWAAVILDLIWVCGSGVLIALQILTTPGNWAVAIVADVVLVFAVLQALGLRKLARD